MKGRATGRRAAIALCAGVLGAAAAFAGLDALSPYESPVERLPAPAPVAGARAGMLVFAREGCGSCHTLAAANATGMIGPELDSRLSGHTRASLRAKILDPYPPSEQGVMPADYRQRLSTAELDALLDFLTSAGARED